MIGESFDLNGFAEVRYTYGDDLIAQHRRVDALTTNSSTYHYDGIGSTRALTDVAGNVTDTYAYTAFGELEDSTGVTTNDYLYTGEQFDPNLGFYYLRARYYNAGIGRFQNMDTWAGTLVEPITQAKFLYANDNPVMLVDPSGNRSLASTATAININAMLQTFGQALITVCAAEFAVTSAVATPVNSPTIGCRNRLHRGRIQAQGGGYEDSESWASFTPPTAAEGTAMLDLLVLRMPRRQLKERNIAVEQARIWILARPPAGVYAPNAQTWSNPGVRGSQARIDIEVIQGRAFQ